MRTLAFQINHTVTTNQEGVEEEWKGRGEGSPSAKFIMYIKKSCLFVVHSKSSVLVGAEY